VGKREESLPHWQLSPHWQSSPQAHLAVEVGVVVALQQVEGLVVAEVALQQVEALEAHMVADVVIGMSLGKLRSMEQRGMLEDGG
jgi:hypothetical protein